MLLGLVINVLSVNDVKKKAWGLSPSIFLRVADDKNYHSEIERNMLYVAVTRAMHRLSLMYCGDLTQFVVSYPNYSVIFPIFNSVLRISYK